MDKLISIQGLSKSFGSRPAIRGLDLQVEQGDIFGFVGPNGAGKTTTIRILATLTTADAGEAYVAGFSVNKQPLEVRRAIGYMPDFFGVYNDMKVWEYLDFFCACYEIEVSARNALIDDLLALVDLNHRKDDYVQGLSRGMKQRLSLARTLVHDPQVLLLDEPASGLDPRARVEIRELMRELSRMGKTIFFSTHILADVAEICNRIGIIEAGEMVALGPLDELGTALLSGRQMQIAVLDQSEALLDFLKASVHVFPESVQLSASNGNQQRIEFLCPGDESAQAALLVELVSAGFPITQYRELDRDLEDVFIQLTQGMVT